MVCGHHRIGPIRQHYNMQPASSVVVKWLCVHKDETHSTTAVSHSADYVGLVGKMHQSPGHIHSVGLLGGVVVSASDL